MTEQQIEDEDSQPLSNEELYDSAQQMTEQQIEDEDSQPLSNEELYDSAQQLTEQQIEDEDEEDRGTREMQTKDLTYILSAIDMAAENLSDIDPDRERSCTVKRGIRSMLHPYYKIPQENKKKSKQLTLYSFLMSSEPRPGPSSAK